MTGLRGLKEALMEAGDDPDEQHRWKGGSGRAREGRRWSPEVMLSGAGSLDLSVDSGWRHWWWSELKEGGVENEKFGSSGFAEMPSL